MSKKIFYIIIIIALLVFGYFAYSYFTKSGNGTDSGAPNIFKNFFPFGGNDVVNTDTPDTNEPDTNEPDQQVDFVQKLRKITGEPVAGAGLLDVKAGTVVRYIEKATGHIYEVELFSPRQGRISNTTIPQVYEAFWGDKNNSLIAQYLKDDDYTIDTYSLTLKDTSTTTENTISGTAISSKISSVSVFDSSVFYLEQNDSSSSGYISNFSGGNKKQIWNSPIKELLSQYVNSKTVSLTTKPEENTPGYMYFVNTGNGSVKKVLGDIKGLSTLTSGDATEVLYLKQDNPPQLFLYNINNNSSEQITPITFPEKCAWSKKDVTIVYCAVTDGSIEENSLTNWYKGRIQFTDDIWKIDLKDKTSNMISNLKQESGENIDVIKPILSESENYLVFVNKRDNSLWSLDLTK